jgi:succinylglutamate desuccinylase
MSSIASKLQESGDFLSLTRQYDKALPELFSFTVSHQQTSAKTRVNVLDTGVIEFIPLEQDGNKDIVLSCAVHGNETAPIEICDQLVKKIITGQLLPEHRVLFLLGNPPAINIGERFVEENLNRLFSGAHCEGDIVNDERKRAKKLEDYVRNFFNQGSELGGERERFHYDLHTAIRGSKNDKFAVYPFRHGKPWVKEQLQFLLACGINTVLLSHSPTTTFSYFSSNEFNAHAFTVELGKVRPFGENNMADFAATQASLTALICGQELSLKVYDEQDFHIYEIYQTINRHHQDFSLHFADDVENFTDFDLDYVLATDGDIEHKVKKQGEAIIFPNANVALGQRALLTVVPTSIE